jgi:hypothetical protein
MLSDVMVENNKRVLSEIMNQLVEHGPGSGTLYSHQQVEQLLQRVIKLFDEHAVRAQTATMQRSILYQGCSILYGADGELDVSAIP